MAERLANAGYDVTEVTSIDALGDLSQFDQIWDFDIHNNLDAADQSAYLGYIQDSKGLFILGENSYSWQNRNQSIVDFIALAGGGTLTLSTQDYHEQYVTSGFNGDGVVAPDSATPLVYNAGAAFTSTGNGYLIATTGPDGTGYGTGIAFGSGSLANAPTGRIMSFLDINMFSKGEWSSYGMALMDRMIAFSAGAFQADPDLPGGGTPPSTVVDNSQASFDLSSNAAQQPVITFDGGMLDMTGGADPANPAVNRNIDILAGGAFINTAGASGGINGQIGGVGGLFVVGGGSLALTQTNSYQGGTAVDGSSLIISASGALSNGGVQLINGTLVLGQGQSLANQFNVTGNTAIVIQQGIANLSGPISGSGALTIIGNANFTGIGSHTGITAIADGRLAVNGSMASTVVAVEGGIIGGNGVVGGLIVRNQATAAPGNSIGTLNVAGTLLFEAGSVYEVEVNAAGGNDRINATGLVTIEGGGVAVLAENGKYRPSTDYTIIASDTGIDGKFTPGAIVTNLAFLDPSLSYSANAVTLTLTRNDIAFAEAATTRNQRASATAIESAFGFGTAVFDEFVGASEGQARRGFDSLSGEINASALSVAAADATAFTRSLLRRTNDAPGTGIRLWTELAAGRTNFDGNGNAAAVRADARGFLVGFETGNDNVVVGVAGGYTDSDARLNGRASKADVKSVNGAVYAKGSFDAVRLRGGAAYTDLKIDTERTAAVGAISNELSARIDGRAIQAFGEAGYELPLGLGSVEPFAGINALWLRNKDFAERGGELALEGDARSHNQVWSTLGVKAGFTLGEASPVSIHTKAGWQHALNGKDMTSRQVFAAGGPQFVVEGVPLARDAALLEAQLQWQASDKVGVSIGYVGSIADQGTVHSGQAAVSLRF